MRLVDYKAQKAIYLPIAFIYFSSNILFGSIVLKLLDIRMYILYFKHK